MISLMRFKSLINFFSEQKNWPKIFWSVFLIISVISLLALFNPNPVFTHDNNYEYWLSGFDRAIRSGQLFPGWIKNFWFDHGSPLFIFYPPLFFYLAEIPRLLGASLVVAVKIAVGLSFVASFFTMYLLAKELWNKWSGLLAGLMYMTASYHFALIYIRGAYAENLAYALFPLGLWFVCKIFQNSKDKKHIIGLAVTTALVILTNVPAVVLYGILMLLWIVILYIQQKNIPLVSSCVGFILAIGLSAFYWLPAFISKDLIQSSFFFNGEFNFSNYFTSIINYLPNQSWVKTDFFQWGILSWIIILLSIIYICQKNKKQIKQNNQLAWLSLLGLAVVVALMTKVSYVLWESCAIIRYIQFPYRFLSLVFIFISILMAYIAYRAIGLGRLMLFFLILIQTITFNTLAVEFRHDIYKQDAVYTVYGDVKAQLILAMQEGGDTKTPNAMKSHTAEDGYLPINVKPNKLKEDFVKITFHSLSPISLQATTQYTIPDSEKIITEGTVSNITEDMRSIEFTHYHDKESRVEYVQSGFPGWQVFINGKQVEWESPDGEISFVIPAGQHGIKIRYTSPLGAVTGRAISAISFLMIAIIWFRKPTLKVKKKTSRLK